MFVEFGFSLLLTHLKRESIDFRSEKNLALLEPFIDILGSALYSVHDSVTMQSMKIFCIIIKYPMQKIRDASPVILKRLFAIIRKASSLASELTQVTFRLLTILIRDCSFVDVSQKQLTTLLTLIRPDLEEPDRQSVVFSMIRAILSRKYVVNEIYDMMEDITRIMVTNQTITIRNLCRQAFLQFLLDYPHGKAKLRSQINFVIKGLEYEHESGRLTILEALHDIISHFSDEILFEYAEIIFMALVLNLVNDESTKCRELTGIVLASLFKRLGPERTEKLVIILKSWFKEDSKPLLKRMAAQAFGFIIDSLTSDAKRWLPGLLKSLNSVLDQFIQIWDAERKEEKEEISLNGWESAYYCLNTLSKALNEFSSDILYDATWMRVVDLMTYPHVWIRTITCRMLGQIFESIPDGNLTSHCLLETEVGLRKLCSRFYQQLDSDNLTSSHGLQIVKNLNFIGKLLIGCNSVVEDAQENMDDDATAGKSTPSLLWLTKKMAFLARSEAGKSRGPLIRQSVFQWFAAVISHIPSQEVSPYLESMIGALYRVVNDETLKGNGTGSFFMKLIDILDELKTLATEVMNHLQKVVGTQVYLEVYNRIHLKIQQIRRERKSMRSIQAVVDPEGRAKRKLQKNEMKRANRKRKAGEFSKQKVKTSLSKRAKAS
jgi:U3 small nucleolar RNA-associated protein 20